MSFLAADIGGTYTRLLLAEPSATGWQVLREQRFVGADYPGLEAIVQLFLGAERPSVACIAVAGPVSEQRVRMTNLPWQLDAGALAAHLDIAQVHLLNDFAAQAYGLDSLPASDLCTLQAGQPEAGGVRALLGAGTGLGMALLVRCAEHWQVLPSQGGLADFAPVDEQQLALCAALQQAYGRASQELLLCGHGLERIHGFLGGRGVLLGTGPNAREISQAAQQGEPLACASLALFARIFAACAGNLALLGLAQGGVYLSGGIAPKMLSFLQQPEVLQAFSDKPPMRELLQRMPLHVVLNEQLGLQGAASLAARLCRAQEGGL